MQRITNTELWRGVGWELCGSNMMQPLSGLRTFYHIKPRVGSSSPTLGWYDAIPLGLNK